MTNLSGTNLNNGAAVGPQGEGRESPSNFPKYPAYKDSGVEWLGAVPEHWGVSPLKWLAEQVTDKATTSEFQVGLENIEGWTGRFIETDTEFAGDGIAFRQEDILFGKLRPYLAKVWLADRPGQAVGDFFVLRPRAVNGDFLHKYILTPTVIEDLNASTIGAKMPRVGWEDMAALAVSLPPYKEQTQIARFLDHETARIDALIEEQQRLIELLKEKRQAVISHAVTKGLDPTAPMKDSGVEWLGEVPEHWVKKRLKNISPFITVGIVVNPSDYVADEGLPFLYGGEVKEGFIEFDKARKISPEDSRKNRKTMLEAGDIVTMRVGYPGVTAVVPPECSGGNCASVMLVKRGKYDSHWLCAVMNSRLVRQQVEMVQYGAAQKQFNISDAIEFWMFEPPIEEQTMIAEFIGRQSSVFDALIGESERSMQLLQERRSALISAAVTGKIDVRGWQPPVSTQAPESAVAEAH
ncbi:restriction endonuclease subunit S [Pseudomonas saudiphocaensis]|uniref:restriction endonuclease subunit S n=1 Tax=Pseudomonas saudiphocaensis TaxID=1499686 RepID=UPI00187D349B|nr:restriction endonuclease subunit S [Pseudomonas saudiphocaensis]MBE7928903.1 restriction endonuclease subunit S [Pseudomonas saudiphocaensis]